MIFEVLLAVAMHCPDFSGRIYLATYPRSGNHWMRYLIEEVTNVATGSVYRDRDTNHQRKPYAWGGYTCLGGYEGTRAYPQSGEQFVVKTHYPADPKKRFDELTCKATLRIVRQPIPSIYSFYMRNRKEPENIVPHEWVVQAVERWKKFQLYWNERPNVTTILYEDLFEHPEEELKQALNAIGLKCTDADIHRAVEKYPPKLGLTDHASHFTQEDLDYIQSELKDLIEQFYPLGEGRIDPLS